jgi:hypothetical protein
MKIAVRRHPDIIFERLDDGSSIVFDRDADRAHALNPSATQVWETLTSPSGEGDLKHVIAECLGVEVDDTAVLNTLYQFQQAGLITVDESPVPLVNYASRRSVLRGLSLSFAAAMAFPLIETLTGTEQASYALNAISMETSSTTTFTTSTTTFTTFTTSTTTFTTFTSSTTTPN